MMITRMTLATVEDVTGVRDDVSDIVEDDM